MGAGRAQAAMTSPIRAPGHRLSPLQAAEGSLIAAAMATAYAHAACECRLCKAVAAYKLVLTNGRTREQRGITGKRS